MIDFHVMKGKGDGYIFQMNLTEKENEKPIPWTPTDAKPDFFGSDQLLDKACCCREKDNPK